MGDDIKDIASENFIMAMYCGTINAFNPDSVTVSNSNNREIL
jgi:hypothetical protein